MNCQVSNWNTWGKCDALCETNGFQRRTRSVIKPTSCGGGTCPSLTERKVCAGGCCPRECTFGDWLPWSKCTAPIGLFILK